MPFRNSEELLLLSSLLTFSTICFNSQNIEGILIPTSGFKKISIPGQAFCPSNRHPHTSFSLIECASICALTDSVSYCQALQFDKDNSRCTCGVVALSNDMNEPLEYVKLHVNLKCAGLDISEGKNELNFIPISSHRSNNDLLPELLSP